MHQKSHERSGRPASALIHGDRKALWALLVLLALAIGLLAWQRLWPTYPTIESYAQKLCGIREQKRSSLRRFFDVRQHHVSALAEAPETLSSLRRLARAWHEHGPDSASYLNVERACQATLSQVAARYDCYDLFLIDADGVVVYSVKKECDFGANVMRPPYRELPIGRCFAGARDDWAFADFDYYQPSDAPGSFLGAPIPDEQGAFAGCLVAQLPLEDINRVMSARTGIGRTGEQYLVRRDGRMVTESRFVADAVLRQTVNTDAATKALRGEQGEGIIQDYRGVSVLSAYTHVDIGSVRWAVIVEIDVDEIVQHLRPAERERVFREVARAIDQAVNCDRISSDILDPSKDPRRVVEFHGLRGKPVLEVETGEFKSCTGDAILFTKGVANCTAVTICGDSFAYLAHISPVDRSYGLSRQSRARLGRLATDIVGDMMIEIMHRRDLRQDGVGKLTIGIFGVHDASFSRIIATLQSHGVGLDQIRFVHNRGPRCVTLVVDHAHRAVYSQWRVADDPESTTNEKFYNLYAAIKPVAQVVADVLRRGV